MAKSYIGTSGSTYVHWGNGVFYPKDVPQTKWLEYYSKQFSTVEINSTFYHLPKSAVFTNWHTRTPDKFVFSVKGSRFITHIKRIRDAGEPIERFSKSVSALTDKLHVVLWQLPPGFKENVLLLMD